MKTILALLSWFAFALSTAAAPPPNIVLIFADDLGWQEPGFAGSDFCETPHLDQLAREGMVFRHAYASAGNCQPSRACMLSGQYAPRHGVYAVGSTDRGPKALMRLIPVPNRSNLPLATVTLGESMRAAGYATGFFGKCHMSDSDKGKSEHAGFEVIKVSKHGLNSDDPNDPKAIFAITDAACEFIEANREKPFFTYIPHYAVHSRLEGRAETLAHFKNKPPGTLGHDNALLAACLADMDTGIGRVLEKIKTLGLEENTLVVFTSDNGSPHVTNEPLRGAKGGYYEGGIRVPMIVRWPGVVTPGTTCDVPVTNVDFFPTFLAAAGASAPASPFDGESLLPLFQSKKDLQRQSIFWHFPGYLDNPVLRGRDPVFRTRPVSVIRKGDWKLHLYHEEWQLDGGREKLSTNRAVELYNLTSDPGERIDLSTTNARQRDELLDDLLAWIQRVPAPLPEKPNPDKAAVDPKAALQAALLREDLAGVKAAVARGRKELQELAGIPEVADKYLPVPDTAKLLTDGEAQQAAKKSFAKLEQLRFWQIGLDPTKLSAPLRAPASVVACMIALHRAKLDDGTEALQQAKEAADFLIWTQEQAGAGCYPFPAAKNTSQDRAMQVATRFLERAEAAGKLGETVRNGWAYEDHGDGGLQFDNGECGVALFELYEATQDQRYLDSALKAADWAMTRPLCANWNYNSFSVNLLAKAHQVTKQPKYLEAALKKAQLGVIPGQLTDGPRAGRWLDPHNARPAYHYIIMTALARLDSELPPEHADRPAVRQSLQLGLIARNSEIVTLGVMNKDKPIECLMLVQRLFAADPEFLAKTKSVEALDTIQRFVSEEARRGKLPLGPRGWGELLERCATLPSR